MNYAGKKVLVTGGLGFIGSNLAIRLVELGARVVVVDASIPGCGANSENLRPAQQDVEFVPVHLAESHRLNRHLTGCDVVFNLAGELSHVHSMQMPERDRELNTVAQLRFVQECARRVPGVRIVYAGTRQVYGVPTHLPVDETHAIAPVDFNGIHKFAAEMYHLLYARLGSLDSVVLRLTNIYGPRMALNNPCQGVLSTFFRRALLKRQIELFGDGRQLRDPLYVDDAVQAFLLAGSRRTIQTRVLNIGSETPVSLREIADELERQAGPFPIHCRPFPSSRQKIDIGSYCTNPRAAAEQLGWKAATPLADGISRTLEFYRLHLQFYLDAAHPDGVCPLLAPQEPQAASQ